MYRRGWRVDVCGRLNERLNRAISCNLAPEVGAHEIRIRNHAYSAQVKSVSVPASGNGRVVVMLGVCVPYASVIEKLETVVGQIVSDAEKGLGILRTAGAVAVVPAIVLAAAVVEKSKKTNNGNICSGAGGK